MSCQYLALFLFLLLPFHSWVASVSCSVFRVECQVGRSKSPVSSLQRHYSRRRTTSPPESWLEGCGRGSSVLSARSICPSHFPTPQRTENPMLLTGRLFALLSNEKFFICMDG